MKEFQKTALVHVCSRWLWKLAILGFMIFPTLQSCDSNGVDPMAQGDKLTAEQQAFADLLAPYADGTLKYSILEGGVEPYVFKEFAKVQLELVNAKGMLYKVTPVLQKKTIADVLSKAKELNPGSALGYGITLSFVKKSSSDETVLTGTVGVTDIKDQNATIPSLDDLPESFGLKLFNDFNPQSTIPTSFYFTKGEELICRIYIGGGGGIYTNFNFGVNPIKNVY